ncbi:MAG: hypothetical protein QXD64_08915, partial [Thermoplasmata archaeon]
TYSDPTKNDTDNDGLLDFDEFLNHSDPWLADTDGDGILDLYENATEQWQIEGRDPWINGSIEANVVTEITIKDCIPTPKVWLTVSFKAEDNAGLSTITVTPQGLASDTANCSGALTYEYSHKWEVPILSWNTWVSGYDVAISIADINGNGCNATAHADGAAEGLIKLILTALVSFVEEVKSLASEAINWIWGQINGLLNTALQPIYEGINLFVQGNYRELAKLFVKKGQVLLSYSKEDVQSMAVNYIQQYVGNIYLRILEIIYTVSNVIASIATAFTTIVNAIVDTVITYCKNMIVSAICGVIPAGFEWVKGIVEVALRGEYAQIPGMIITQLRAEIMKMIGVLKEYTRTAMEKVGTAISDIEGYIEGIMDLVIQLLSKPQTSLFALLGSDNGGLGALEKIPFLAQGKAFASSVGGIVLAVNGMKRDWKVLLYQYSGIIMAIVMDFVKKYLPLELPPNPTERDIQKAIEKKMNEILNKLSESASVQLTSILDTGINLIYETIVKAVAGIEFYKKDVVMEKVRCFVKERIRGVLVDGLYNGLKVFATIPESNAPLTIRPENILVGIVENISKSVMDYLTSATNNIITELKEYIGNVINEVMQGLENAINGQLQTAQMIINDVKEKIDNVKEQIKNALRVATEIIRDPVKAGKEILVELLRPYLPPVFLKILVVISDLYAVFSSGMALAKYIKNMGSANIILKGIGIATTSASLIMTISQTYNDIQQVIQETKL